MKRVFLLFLLAILLLSWNSQAESSEFDQYLKQGNTFFEQKDWDAAINSYNRAIEINPKVAGIHFNLGLAYFYKRLEIVQTNQKKELQQFLENAENQDWKTNDKVITGEDAATRVLIEKEVEEWKKTIELDDTISGAHYFLGTHYHNTRRFGDAEKELKRAIELDPKYANSYGVLASVYEKIGKNGQAIEYHKKVLQIDPEDEYSRYNLVLLYSKLGMKKEALEEYEILKRKNSIFAPELKSMLEREQ